MAQDKKSFVLYVDLIHTVEKLPDDMAGQLFKHLLRYVNDQYPDAPNTLIDVVFEPIKQQLKRDLKKYEVKQKQWSEAGKASAEAKRLAKMADNEPITNSTDVDERSNRSTDSTVSVNDNVNVSVNATNTGSTNVELVGIADYSKIIKDLKGITNFIRTKNPKFYEPYVDLWNLFAEKFGPAKVKTISNSRKRKLKVRLNEKAFDFTEILKQASEQKFALESSWFTFDFLIENDTNYCKVLEKKYIQKSDDNSQLKKSNYVNA